MTKSDGNPDPVPGAVNRDGFERSRKVPRDVIPQENDATDFDLPTRGARDRIDKADDTVDVSKSDKLI